MTLLITINRDNIYKNELIRNIISLPRGGKVSWVPGGTESPRVPGVGNDIWKLAHIIKNCYEIKYENDNRVIIYDIEYIRILKL